MLEDLEQRGIRSFATKIDGALGRLLTDINACALPTCEACVGMAKEAMPRATAAGVDVSGSDSQRKPASLDSFLGDGRCILSGGLFAIPSFYLAISSLQQTT